jgi:hypothetical protein
MVTSQHTPVALVAVAVSARPPDVSSLGPGEIIDTLFSARQTGDVDSDASLTDSARDASRGMDPATCFIEQYTGFEPGRRQVTGNEVVWLFQSVRLLTSSSSGRHSRNFRQKFPARPLFRRYALW